MVNVSLKSTMRISDQMTIGKSHLFLHIHLNSVFSHTVKAAKNIKTVWVAAVAYMADTREITNKEVPDYDLSQLLRSVSYILPKQSKFFIPVFEPTKSDIGGAAGLFLAGLLSVNKLL